MSSYFTTRKDQKPKNYLRMATRLKEYEIPACATKTQLASFVELVDRSYRYIGLASLADLSRMAGRGWLVGLALGMKLQAVMVMVPELRFWLEIRSIFESTGRQVSSGPLPSKFLVELERACGECGKAKPASEFSPTMSSEEEPTWVAFKTVCDKCRLDRKTRIARANGNIRRVRELTAFGGHTEAEWRSIVEQYGGKCLRCGTVGAVTKDHVRPLAKGGSNDPDNLQPLCGRCNSWKNDREMDFRPKHLHKEMFCASV